CARRGNWGDWYFDVW
nr:immunoglobulin heavy chain junction region [Mus musculus]MBK4197521.1 immunoglobulin heavy chain junction region [Mus musculus]